MSSLPARVMNTIKRSRLSGKATFCAWFLATVITVGPADDLSHPFGSVVLVVMLVIGLFLLVAYKQTHPATAVGPPPPPQIPKRPVAETQRCADGDRESTVTVLHAAAAAGRLDPDELDDRVGRAYNAKTYADLRVLTTDLPT